MKIRTSFHQGIAIRSEAKELLLLFGGAIFHPAHG